MNFQYKIKSENCKNLNNEYFNKEKRYTELLKLIMEFINIQIDLQIVECNDLDQLYNEKRQNILDKRSYFLYNLFVFFNKNYCGECFIEATEYFNQSVENILSNDIYENYRFKI